MLYRNTYLDDWDSLFHLFPSKVFFFFKLFFSFGNMELTFEKTRMSYVNLIQRKLNK